MLERVLDRKMESIACAQKTDCVPAPCNQNADSIPKPPAEGKS